MAGGHVRKDLGAVMYAPNVLGSRGPRKMQVAIPRVEEEGKGRGKCAACVCAWGVVVAVAVAAVAIASLFLGRCHAPRVARCVHVSSFVPHLPPPSACASFFNRAAVRASSNPDDSILARMKVRP